MFFTVIWPEIFATWKYSSKGPLLRRPTEGDTNSSSLVQRFLVRSNSGVDGLEEPRVTGTSVRYFGLVECRMSRLEGEPTDTRA